MTEEKKVETNQSILWLSGRSKPMMEKSYGVFLRTLLSTTKTVIDYKYMYFRKSFCVQIIKKQGSRDPVY
jgi:hypothetical protein